MTITKKQLTLSTLIILGLVAIGFASVFAIQTYIKSNEAANKTDQVKIESGAKITSEAEATTSLSTAKQARAAHDFTKAMTIYQAVRAYYETAGNSEKTADIDVTLSLLASEQKNFVPQPKPTLAGEK